MPLSCKNIRNVALCGHNTTGKTTLNEAILFHSSVINKAESIQSGKTVSDYTEEEIQKQISIHSSLSSFEYQTRRINMLDMPGTADFIGECICGFRSCESAIMLMDYKFGPQIETFKLWKRLNNRNKPRMVFLNKCDKEEINNHVYELIDNMKDSLKKDFIIFSIPYFENNEYKGVIDILNKKLYTFSQSSKEKAQDIPEQCKQKVNELTTNIIEKAAEGNDELMEKFFENGTLDNDDVILGLSEGFTQNNFVPVFSGSALNISGIESLMNFIVNIAPNPENKRDYKYNEKKERVNAYINSHGPFSGYIFKTVIDQFSGKLNYVKVVNGTLFADTEFINPLYGKKEKAGKLYRAVGKKLIETPLLATGDIGIISKCQSLETNATIRSSATDSTIYASLLFPSPVYSIAISTDDKKNEVKLSEYLKKISQEDLTVKLEYNSETGETTLQGMGEMQLDMILSKAMDKLKVKINTKLPEIAYRETITKRVPMTEYTHKKQTGGHGQYARVVIDVEPLERGEYYKFANVIRGGSVSKGYVPGIEKGLQDAMKEGFVAGYPLVDISITLVDGKEHPVDSSEMAFRLAASGALKEALSKAGVVLLEPFGKMTVYVEDKYVGDILSDISLKRGRVLNQENLGSEMTAINAEVPLASMRDYALCLKSITSGTGSFEIEPSHYEVISGKLAEDVIKAREN